MGSAMLRAPRVPMPYGYANLEWKRANPEPQTSRCWNGSSARAHSWPLCFPDRDDEHHRLALSRVLVAELEHGFQVVRKEALMRQELPASHHALDLGLGD